MELLPDWPSLEQLQESTYIFAVFRLGEVDQVVVVHVLGVEQVTILLLAEIFRVNPVGPEEFLVCHAKCLPDGLCNQLGLDSSQRGKAKINRAALLVDSRGARRTMAPKASASPAGLHEKLVLAAGHFQN